MAKRRRPGDGSARAAKPRKQGRPPHKPRRRKHKADAEAVEEVERFTYQNTFTQKDDDN